MEIKDTNQFKKSLKIASLNASKSMKASIAWVFSPDPCDFSPYSSNFYHAI